MKFLKYFSSNCESFSLQNNSKVFFMIWITFQSARKLLKAQPALRKPPLSFGRFLLIFGKLWSTKYAIYKNHLKPHKSFSWNVLKNSTENKIFSRIRTKFLSWIEQNKLNFQTKSSKGILFMIWMEFCFFFMI